MYAQLAFGKHLQLFTVTSLRSMSPRVEAVASVAHPHPDSASAATCEIKRKCHLFRALLHQKGAAKEKKGAAKEKRLFCSNGTVPALLSA